MKTNRTTNIKFKWRSLAELSSPNKFATPTEKSSPTAQFQICHRTMGRKASFKTNVWGRIARTAKT